MVRSAVLIPVADESRSCSISPLRRKDVLLNSRNPEHVEVIFSFDEDGTRLIACRNAYTILGYIILPSCGWFSIS